MRRTTKRRSCPTLSVIRCRPRDVAGAGILRDPAELERRRPPTCQTTAEFGGAVSDEIADARDLLLRAHERWDELDRADRTHPLYVRRLERLSLHILLLEHSMKDGRRSNRTRAALQAQIHEIRAEQARVEQAGPQAPARAARLSHAKKRPEENVGEALLLWGVLSASGERYLRVTAYDEGDTGEGAPVAQVDIAGAHLELQATLYVAIRDAIERHRMAKGKHLGRHAHLTVC